MTEGHRSQPQSELPSGLPQVSLPQIVIGTFLLLGGLMVLSGFGVPAPQVRLAEKESLQAGSNQGSDQAEASVVPGALPGHVSQLSSTRRPLRTAVGAPARGNSRAARRGLDVDAGESDAMTSESSDEAERGAAGTSAEPSPLPRRPAVSPFPRSNFAPDHVDVVVLCDAKYAMGVAAIINAARKHTRVPVRIFVGFDGEPSMLYEYLACVGVSADPAEVIIRRSVPLILPEDMPKAIEGRERLQSASNYARFTIPRTFPELHVAFYLDVDTLPISDLSMPVASFRESGALISPTVRKHKPVSYAFHADFEEAYQDRYGISFEGGAPSFNAGVWLADFSLWVRHHIDTEALYWVKANALRVAEGKPPFWDLATQPISYAVFNRDVGSDSPALSRSWNCDATTKLSGKGAPKRWPAGCKIMHWFGRDKPWQPEAEGHALWTRYLPRVHDPQCFGILGLGGASGADAAPQRAEAAREETEPELNAAAQAAADADADAEGPSADA